MYEKTWWETFDKHRDEIRALVVRYHPATEVKHRMRITAYNAEAAAQIVRESIKKRTKVPAVQQFDVMVEKHDTNELIRLLNEAWFGMPESTDVRYEPGFYELCDLCEGIDDGSFEED